MKVEIVKCISDKSENLQYLRITNHTFPELCSAISAVTQSVQWMFQNAFYSFENGETIIIVDDKLEVKYFVRLCEFIVDLCKQDDRILVEKKICTSWNYTVIDDIANIDFLEFVRI